ncbi:hypothetical protein ACO0QE_003528 [Hanseniaspora vineae]
MAPSVDSNLPEKNEASNSQQPTKSILKSSQREGELIPYFGNVVRAKRQSLIDNGENNTTSRIDTVSLHQKLLVQEKKRRVSFAPDVTLRTVDFQNIIGAKLPDGRDHSENVSNEEPEESEMELTNPINNAVRVEAASSAQLTNNDTDDQDEADSQKHDMEITEIFTKNKATQKLKNEASSHQDVFLSKKSEKENNFKEKNSMAQLTSQSSEDESNANMSMDLTTFQNLDNKMEDSRKVEEPNDTSNMDMDMDMDLSEGADMELTYMNIDSKGVNNEKNDFVSDHQEEKHLTSENDFDKVPTEKKARISISNPRSSSLESGYASEERLSPIPLKRLSSNHEQEHAPVPTKKQKHKNLSLPEPISTLPSVDDYVQIPEDQNLLVQFLKASKVDYLHKLPQLQDFNLKNNVKPFNFNAFKYKPEVSTAEVYKELYANLPFLIILKYMWIELNRKISKSKSRFALLEKELSDNPSKLPALLSLFLSDSTSPDEKAKLHNYIYVLKQNSDLVAESVWLNWRVNQVEGINSDLEDGLTNLQAEIINNETERENIAKMRQEAETMYNGYVREFEKQKIMHNQQTSTIVQNDNLNEVKSNISFEQKLKWVEKKNHLLKKYNVDIGDFESYSSRRSDVLKALSSVSSRQLSKAKAEDSQLKMFEKKFADQRNSIHFLRSSNMIIAIIKFPSIRISFGDDLNDTSSFKINLDSQDEFTKMWFRKLLHNIEDSNLKDKYEYLRYVMEARRKYEIIFSNYNKLCLFFVTKTIDTKSGGIIQFQSVTKWNKITIQLTFSQFTQLVLYNKPVTSKRKVINYNMSAPLLQDSFTAFPTEHMFAASNTSVANPSLPVGAAANSTGIFGASASTPQSTPAPATNMFQQPKTASNQSGLFGGAAMSTPSPASNNLFNKPTTTAPTFSSGLSGLNSSTKPSTFSGSSLFGNRNNGLFNQQNNSSTTQSGGLFGSSTLSNNASTNKGLFSNSGTGGLFGGSSLGNAPTNSNSLFGNASSFLPLNSSQQPHNNAYGLVINQEINGDVMPPPLTGSSDKTQSQLSHQDFKPITRQSRLGLSSLRSLSSRLHASPGPDGVKGIFLPSSDVSVSNENKDLVLGNKKFAANGKIAKRDSSGIRKLKIDPKRIESKKRKLLQTFKNTIEAQESSKNLVNSKANDLQSKDLLLLNDKADKNKLSFSENKDENCKNEANHKSDVESLPGSSNSTSELCDYWCSPTVAELKKMSQTELSKIQSFAIGRKGYGTINFDYAVDLRDFSENFERALFGDVVIFHENKTVEVYPDETHKPNVGNGLNVPATVSLDKIFPVGYDPVKDNLKDVNEFVKTLKSQPATEFVSYDPFSGAWVFKVRHFSIYGLLNPESSSSSHAYSPYGNSNRAPVPGTFSTEQDARKAVSPVAKAEFLTTPLDAEDLDHLVEQPENLNEMDYEPSDVEPEDFDVLEHDPRLSVSNDLVEQLRIVGSSDHSIFKPRSACETTDLDKILFKSFNNKVESHKEILKQRKMENNSSFVHFSGNSSISLKSPSSLSSSSPGFKIVDVPLIKCEEYLMNIFADIIPRTMFDKRLTNEFPKVSSVGFQFKNLMRIQPDEERWQLLSILFDKIKVKDMVESEDVRKTLVTRKQWTKLTTWVNQRVSEDVNRRIADASDDLEKIVLHMVLRNTVEATKLCITSGNAHLAAMVAMSTSNDFNFKKLAQIQLVKWKNLGYPVNPHILQLYKIFAHEVFSIDELPWLANFAMYINYADFSNQSLAQEIEHFFTKTQHGFASNDMLFNIFKLFYLIPKDKHNTLLSTFKFEDKPLDYVVPWFIVQVLSLKNKISIDPTQKDIFSLNFIEQLKLNGLFEESLYVTSFIENDTLAKEQCTEVLRLNIDKFEENLNYLFKLQLPESEVYYSLALLYKNKHDFLKESEFYLKARKYENASKVVTEVLGPKILLSGSTENSQILQELIGQFPDICKTNAWKENVGVFELYLKYLSDPDISLLKELINYVDVFSSSKGFLIECRAVSTKICKFIVAEFLKNKNTLDAATKNLLLKLPLGEAEEHYTQRLLNTM